jgi:hypothetical protein
MEQCGRINIFRNLTCRRTEATFVLSVCFMHHVETQHNRITINDSFKIYMVHQNHGCKEISYSIQAECRESIVGTATLYWLYGYGFQIQRGEIFRTIPD